MQSTLIVYDASKELYETRSKLYGFACYLMSVAPSHARLPMQYLTSVICPAVLLENIKFYFDEFGMLVGYVIWADLAEDVERRFFTTGRFDLHMSEWNEGNSLWIIDFIAPYGNLKYILRDMRDVLFANRQEVRYARVEGNRRITKALSRASHSSFFLPPERIEV